MSEFGLKIKNIAAAVLYEVNSGVREYFDYTDAMLNNQLFLYFMKKHGLKDYKGESTRDIICLSFDFGTKDYNEEVKRVKKMIEKAESDEDKNKYTAILQRIEKNKDCYQKLSRGKLREVIYENGIDVTYTNPPTRKNPEETKETIHYKYLFRTPAKAKVGKAMFINQELYDVARDWLTMGLDKLMPQENAKIVELQAYSSLTVQSVVETMHIPVQDIVILKDQDSFIRTMADVVKTEDYVIGTGKDVVTKKKCIVSTEEVDVKNTMWDGMGLIEDGIMPEDANGMVLLRNHFFKMCGFRTNLQLFFKDWCERTGNDYQTYAIEDMFGYKHRLKDIKVLTTDNAIKWKKFMNIMSKDGSPKMAYEYWEKRVQDDGCMWGVVKTDHPSKLGDYQQMSYQMINTLPCTKDDIQEIADTNIQYIYKLKNDPDTFERYLRQNANIANHYEMLADLYQWNHDFVGTEFFKYERKKIINEYVDMLKTGKVFVDADNLTVCGNPYALLLYSVGEDWENDPTLNVEDGCIQCYTTRFKDGEYLAAFRQPQNSSNNIAYLHNRFSPEMERYFNFSNNIMAVNCIHTTVQARMNGEDFDSDFNFVTCEKTIVKCAKTAYENFNTIVNAIEESTLSYNNTLADYAKMDNAMAESQLGIGWSSNLAMLSLTYYWTEMAKEESLRDQDRLKELYDNFVILAVLAQIIIDQSKRVYTISGLQEIIRIQSMSCMQYIKRETDPNGKLRKYKYDLPLFMKFVREPSYTKNGELIPFETVRANKEKLERRINPEFICPMNWLVECLDRSRIKRADFVEDVPLRSLFIKDMSGEKKRQRTAPHRIRQYIDNYNSYVKRNHSDSDDPSLFISKTEELLDKVRGLKLGYATLNRLVETALGIEEADGTKSNYRGVNRKYRRKILDCLYKTNRENFMKCFIYKGF